MVKLLMASMESDPGKRSVKQLRAAVVGGGHFGRFHAEKYSRHHGVDFVGVVDPVPGLAEDLCAKWGGAAFRDVAALPGDLDCISLATPAGSHGNLARYFLEKGVHVLVEKPLATQLEEAQGLINLAGNHKRILQVNHQERYFLKEAGLPECLGAIQHIQVKRVGPAPPKAPDCSVILDIMVHDLDWIRAFLPDDRYTVSVAEANMGSSGFIETLEAEIRFSSGIGVHMHASREHRERLRKAVIDAANGRFLIDFMERTVTDEEGSALFPGDATVRDQLYGDHPFDDLDFVGKSVAHFIQCVQTGRQPLVDGNGGARALETALAMETATDSHVKDL